jgi:hypothetical protein
MPLTKLIWLLMLVTPLAACGTVKPGSVEGLIAVIEPPPCAVEATTREGQHWIDSTVERGVAALGWKRPQDDCVDPPTPAPRSTKPRR